MRRTGRSSHRPRAPESISTLQTTTLNTYSDLWPTAEDRTRAAAEAMPRQAHRNIPRNPRGLTKEFTPLTWANAAQDTLKRNSTTSPSCITYSLPSTRAFPAARTAASDPARIKSS